MRHGPTILIVEDSAETRELLRTVLGQEGYTVLEAATGVEALETARREYPNLILMDVMLPGLDGFKICRMLKYDAKYAQIPVLLLSARSSDEDDDLTAAVRADGFLTKPVDVPRLLEAVRGRIGSVEGVGGRPLRILVVEDDAELLPLVAKALASRGHEVLTAATGEEAAALARRERPDLILMDIMLPDRNGPDVVHDLQGDPAAGRIPVVFLSGVVAGEEGGRHSEITVGERRYPALAKPFTMRDLFAVLPSTPGWSSPDGTGGAAVTGGRPPSAS